MLTSIRMTSLAEARWPSLNFESVAGLTDDLDVGLGFEQPPNTLSQQLVIISQQHPDHP